MKKVLSRDGFDIYFEALEENIRIDEDFMDASMIEETIADLESGETVMFCAKVTAFKNGIELASDYLGACIYECEEDFYIKYKDCYFADMVNTVISEAKEDIASLVA